MIKKLALVGLVALTSCSLSGRKENAVYNLSPQLTVAESKCRSGAGIEIAAPTTSAGLEGRRVAVVEESKLNYYTGIRWAAPASDMVQQVMVESFEKSKAFKTVTTDVDGVGAEYVLLTDIRDYQVTNAKAPTVKLRFISKLVRDRKVVATIPVEKVVTPAENKTAAIVEAFNKATADAAADLVVAASKKVGCGK